MRCWTPDVGLWTRDCSYAVTYQEAPTLLLHARFRLRWRGQGSSLREHLRGAYRLPRSMLEGLDLMFQPWRCGCAGEWRVLRLQGMQMTWGGGTFLAKYPKAEETEFKVVIFLEIRLDPRFT